MKSNNNKNGWNETENTYTCISVISVKVIGNVYTCQVLNK
jgi:hypothetical protein